MSFETRELFKRVLRKAIDLEVQIEHIRRKIDINLQKLGGAELRQIFSQIDWINRGFICKSDVKRTVDFFSDHLSDVMIN